MIRVFSGNKGTIGYSIEVNQAGLAYFSKAHQNAIVRTTYKAAGDFWINAWLFKRFSTYAYSLGYYASRAWQALKKSALGHAIPFVGFTPIGGGPGKPIPSKRRTRRPVQINGEKMMEAANGARSVGYAYGKSGSARVEILIPIGHPVQPNAIQAFTTVPEVEVASMAGAAMRTMTSLLDGAQPIADAKQGAPSRTIQGANSPVRSIGVTPRKLGS